MSSKREEERNEKIIRGLMKLPPNRRCINCNSMGPQYVCTNFWTFVCTICSGIHREFTHRVKSVSMSKFTSQEVEALQNGGNQRARETFLKEWDLQRQRFPNSNNVDRVRDFIKAVYVDRKYAGGNKSDKLPKDVESEKFGADEARRASSYHSYSQSPPYDFQYEDRLNRKQGGPFARKPGSDRSLYDRKAASFVYSPGRFSDHHFEDRFANEGSSSRVSDYSVSSGGDPIRSAPQSPNLQKDDGFSSPVSDSSRETDGLQRQAGSPYPEGAVKRDADRVPAPRPQRSVSSGSFGSFEKITGSIQPIASGSAMDGSIETNLSVINNQNKAFAFPPPSQLSAENVGQFTDFRDPFGMPASSPASAVDLLEAPATGSAVSIDLFQSPDSTVLSQKFPPSSSFSYFHENSQDSSVSKSNQKISEPSETADEGWATFDLPQLSEASTRTVTSEVTESHSEIGVALNDFDSFSSSNVGLPWSAFQNVPVHESTPSVSNSWDQGMHMNITTNEESSEWKAFEETIEQRHTLVDVQGTGLPVSAGNTSSTFELFQHPNMAEDTADGIHKLASNEGFSFPTLPSHVSSGSTFNQPNHPFLADLPNTGNRSVNPFDASFDSEFEANNTFLNMSSLESTLPSTRLPTPYAGGINESWFPVNPLEPQGPMSFITAQAPSSQLTNVSHEPVASVGGNPFA